MRLIKDSKIHTIHINNVLEEHIILAFNPNCSYWMILSRINITSNKFMFVPLRTPFNSSDNHGQYSSLKEALNAFEEVEVFDTFKEAIAFLHEQYTEEEEELT